jgi:hypothetical protein
LRWIPRYHSIYHAVDHELIGWVDDHFAVGNFRHWAKFTKTAISTLAKTREPALTQDVAETALLLMGGLADAA